MTQPTPPSLIALHDALKSEGVDVSKLGVAIVGPTESYFGEISDTGELTPASPFDKTIRIKDPKRISRVMSVAQGRLSIEVPFTDFDMVINGSIVLVRHIGGFMLEWLDEQSQMNYLRSYLGFLEGRKRARAKAAGIHLPGEE